MIEAYRRVTFISLLSLFDNDQKAYAAAAGILLSLLSIDLYDKGQPFHLESTNTLAVVASKQLFLSYLSGSLLIVKPQLYGGMGGTILLDINISIFPLAVLMGMADHKERMKKTQEIQKLRQKLDVCTAKDRKK